MNIRAEHEESRVIDVVSTNCFLGSILVDHNSAYLPSCTIHVRSVWFFQLVRLERGMLMLLDQDEDVTLLRSVSD